jgi:hypothetical protein
MFLSRRRMKQGNGKEEKKKEQPLPVEITKVISSIN